MFTRRGLEEKCPYKTCPATSVRNSEGNLSFSGVYAAEMKGRGGGGGGGGVH